MDIGWTEDHCARLDEIAAEDHSFFATAAERTRRENIWVLVLNSSGPNGPMNQREDQDIFAKFYINNPATLTQDFIPGCKFDNDQINHSLGTTKDLNVSTQDGLEVVQLEPISQLFFLGMATVFVVAIFSMVTDIMVGER